MVKRYFLPFYFFFYLFKHRTQLLGYSITIGQAELNSGHSVEEDEYKYLQAMNFSEPLKIS